jgi:hypothetical protein
VLRMMARTSMISFVIIVALVGVPVLLRFFFRGWDQIESSALRNLAAMAVLMPASQFGLGLCYYKTRDSLWGALGVRRSRVNAILWSALAALVAFAAAIGFVASVEGTDAHAIGSFPALGLIAMYTTITLLLLARARGQTEIQDTIWATLDLEAAA